MSFPDVLPPLVAHLTSVTGVEAMTRVPDPRPGEFVQLRRVGGSALVPVRDQARIDVWAWAESDERSMGIALQVREAVWALAGATLGALQVYAVSEFLGPRLDDDPISGASGQSRRTWATYEIQIRAESAIQFVA